MVVVRYAVLDPGRIFNLTSPRYLPEISLKWMGRYHWHHFRYEPVRDIIEAHYIARFNDVSGHYDRLLKSIAKDGFRNPIMVSAGGLQCRKRTELPPSVRNDDKLVVSEYLGGSRLWAAQRLGVPVPCIVNDYADVLPDAEVLRNQHDVLAKFADVPERIEFPRKGAVRLNNLPFTHIPKADRYDMAGQIAIRRAIVSECRQKAVEWVAENDL